MRTYRNQNTETEFSPAELWINVGFYVENPQTGEEQFVSLARGIPLDSIEEDVVTRPDTDYGQMLLARNQILRDLKEAGMKLEKGSSRKLPMLQAELRRKRDAATETPDLSKNMFYKKVV